MTKRCTVTLRTGVLAGIVVVVLGSAQWSPLAAHRLDVLVYPSKDGFRVRVLYDDGAVAQEARVEVHADQWRLASAFVDRYGWFPFLTATPQDLRIVANDRQGHRAELFLSEEEVCTLLSADSATLDFDSPVASSEHRGLFRLDVVGGTSVVIALGFISYFLVRQRRKHAPS